MVQNVNPTFVKTPNRGVALISTGTGIALSTIYTGGTSGSKVTGINVTTSSTSAVTVFFYLTSGTSYIFTTLSVPASAGVSVGVPPVSVLSVANTPGLPLDSDGNPYLILASSADLLQMSASATVPTTGGNVYAVAVAGDF